MKYLGILVVLISTILLFGCVSQPLTSGQNTSGSGTGNVTNTTTVTTTGGITNYTTTTEEGNITVTTNIGSSESDWCIAGQFYDISGTGAVGDTGAISGKIKGFVTYKGGQYCQVDATLNTAGYNLAYTYYISQDEKDMWVTTSIGGQTQEIHVNAETGEMITS